MAAFQSTLPARGATISRRFGFPRRLISIHAPRTGSDGTTWRATSTPKHFNPRSPHGERRAYTCPTPCLSAYFNPRSPHGERHSHTAPTVQATKISIHAPRTGSDVSTILPFLFDAISIHAPRTGSDAVNHVSLSIQRYFNPRSPHGERRRMRTR